MKKIRRSKIVGAVIAFALTGWVSAASAALTLGYLGQHAGQSSTVILAGYGNYNTTQGGPFHWVKTRGSFPAPVEFMKDYSVAGDAHHVPGQFTTFCIELVEHIVNSIVFEPYLDLSVTPDLNGSYPAMGPAAADRLRVLWANNIAEVFDQDADDLIQRAAFQLAIWEIVYDGGDDASPLSSDKLKAGSVASDTVGALADYWVTTAANNASDATHRRANLLAFSNSQRQDQVGEYVTPEPATLAIWACFCVGGLILARRRYSTAALATSPAA